MDSFQYRGTNCIGVTLFTISFVRNSSPFRGLFIVPEIEFFTAVRSPSTPKMEEGRKRIASEEFRF